MAGTVLRSDKLELRRLGRSTSLWAWVPDHLNPGGFPVVYMHDGDNLFHAAASNAGEWRVDEVMAARNDAVIVGIPNAEERRMRYDNSAGPPYETLEFGVIDGYPVAAAFGLERWD